MRVFPQLAYWAVFVALALPNMVSAQKVVLPKQVTGQAGEWVVIVPDAKEGGEVKWKLSDGLTQVRLDILFPGQKPAGIVVKGPRGKYKVWAWNALKDVASDLSECEVQIGDPIPPPPPPVVKIAVPNAVGLLGKDALDLMTAAGLVGKLDGDAGQKVVSQSPASGALVLPGTSVTVSTGAPAPFPADGLHVLIVFDDNARDKLTSDQIKAVYGTSFRTWLHDRCAKVVQDVGGDGSAWRIWPNTAPVDNAPQVWKDAFARKRDSLPWIAISNGKTGYEGPLPATMTDIGSLIDRYK